MALYEAQQLFRKHLVPLHVPAFLILRRRAYSMSIRNYLPRVTKLSCAACEQGSEGSRPAHAAETESVQGDAEELNERLFELRVEVQNLADDTNISVASINRKVLLTIFSRKQQQRVLLLPRSCVHTMLFTCRSVRSSLVCTETYQCDTQFVACQHDHACFFPL